MPLQTARGEHNHYINSKLHEGTGVLLFLYVPSMGTIHRAAGTVSRPTLYIMVNASPLVHGGVLLRHGSAIGVLPS